MIGDVFGDAGVRAAAAFINETRRSRAADFIVANAENAAHRGSGLSKPAAAALFDAGADVLTLGNHTFKDRDIHNLFKEYKHIIRPANYPEGAPGNGAVVCETPCGPVGVVNLLGRLYMEACDSPFGAIEGILLALGEKTKTIIVDFHAEATSEKKALAYCADGMCSLVAGTHTHVQTSDEQILPFGTAFITDVGMTGPADGIIGVKREAAIGRFRTLIPERYTPAEGRVQLNAVTADIDERDGRATSINRINIIYD